MQDQIARVLAKGNPALDELLRSLLAAGSSIDTIGSRLSRSQSAVRHRARKFGIRLPAARRAENPNWHEAAEGAEEMSGEEKSTDLPLSEKTWRAD